MMVFLMNNFVCNLLLLHVGLHSLVIVVVRPSQFARSIIESSFIKKALSNKSQEQSLPSVEGVGLLQCCNCDTVYSPHDPLLRWQVGNCSLHLPSTIMNEIRK